MKLYTIRDGTHDGYPQSLEQLPAALAGMQAAVRKRCSVVTWSEAEIVPADEWLDRMRRAEMATIPPDAEVTS